MSPDPAFTASLKPKAKLLVTEIPVELSAGEMRCRSGAAVSAMRGPGSARCALNASRGTTPDASNPLGVTTPGDWRCDSATPQLTVEPRTRPGRHQPRPGGKNRWNRLLVSFAEPNRGCKVNRI